MPITKGTPESIRRILDVGEEISYLDNYYDPKEDVKIKPQKTKTPKTKKPKTPPSEVKNEIIMKASSLSLSKNEKGKPAVDTDMSVKKHISDKMKRALRKSVIAALENELKGAGLIMSDSDSSSSDEESVKPPKRKGRPKKKST